MQTQIEAIRERAYQLWEARGRRDGHADEDWIEAECQVLASQTAQSPTASRAIDEASKESFPASDPPGSQLPDEPPANAQAKWAAAGKRQRNARSTPPIKVPNPPEDEVDRTLPEKPKLGSRDALGG
jgi:hypothetical protein